MSMLVFIPGLPQRIKVIPDPDNQSTQPYWTMIDVGEWYLDDSKMLRLILQPFHKESPQKELFPSDLRLTVNQLMPIRWILVGWKGKPVYPIMYSRDQDILKKMMTFGFIRKLDQCSFSPNPNPNNWDDNTEKDDRTSRCVRDKWGSRLYLTGSYL
jgi:hypothetical protein